MKKLLMAASLFSIALFLPMLPAAAQAWDPDGTVPGTGVSGNWDTVSANWCPGFDLGGNSTWTQGSAAVFNVDSNYTVTVTEPITVGSVTVSGTAGTLTIDRTAANGLTMAADSIFNIGGSRTLNLSAPVAGGFSVTKSGNGTLTLSGANTYSGGTFLSSGNGSIGIAVDTVSSGGVITSSALGTGPITVSVAGHVLFASGGARVLQNPVTLLAGITIGGSANLTFTNGNWQVNTGTRIITVNNSAITRIDSNLTDDGTARTLQKAGTGTLILGGNNSSFLGSLTVNANSGTLAIGSDTALQVGSVVTVNSGGTLNLNGFNGKVIGLAGAGAVALGGGTLTIANAGTSRNQQGQITGSGSLIVSNSISQQMEGTNTFTGGMTVKAGTLFLRINPAVGDNITRAAGTGTITMEGSADPVVANVTAALGGNATTGIVIITNRIVMASGKSLFFASNGGTVQFDSQISGPGAWVRSDSGSGPVILTGSNTFSGGLQIESRVLGLGNKYALGSGPFTIGNPTTPPANTINLVPGIDLTGANAITNPTAINQNFTVSGTNSFELAGPMTISAGLKTFTFSTSGTTKFSGNIDGAGGFIKSGSGLLILTGNNTYSGDTAAGIGTLLINNTAGSGTSTGTVTVVTDAMLGGTGTIGGPVVVNSGGLIGAGSSAGKLTLTNGLDLSTGGINLWELVADKDQSSGTAGVDFDQISITGGNLVLGGSATLLIHTTNSATFPSATNAFWQSNHSWKIIALSGGATNSGNLNFVTLSGTNDFSAGTFSTSVDGSGSIILSFTSASPQRPGISGVAKNGSNFIFSGTNGTAGHSYVVYSSANIALPLSSWTPEMTNAFGPGGTFSVTNSISAPRKFFLIGVPVP